MADRVLVRVRATGLIYGTCPAAGDDPDEATLLVTPGTGGYLVAAGDDGHAAVWDRALVQDPDGLTLAAIAEAAVDSEQPIADVLEHLADWDVDSDDEGDDEDEGECCEGPCDCHDDEAHVLKIEDYTDPIGPAPPMTGRRDEILAEFVRDITDEVVRLTHNIQAIVSEHQRNSD